MEDQFKIYIDRLRDGKVEELSREISPDFIDLEDSELKFPFPVFIGGEAYLADDSLVLRLNIDTKGVLPCAICNEPVEQEISIKGVYHVVPTEEVMGGVFEIKEILRESIILEAPAFVECNQGSCSQRKEVEKYMRSESTGTNDTDEVYHPFKDL